jgi:hypothetical protein
VEASRGHGVCLKIETRAFKGLRHETGSHPLNTLPKESAMNPSEQRNDAGSRMMELVGNLQTLRDEIRLELHLGGMEAKERWRALEPLVHEAAVLGSDVSQVLVGELVEKLKHLKATLKRGGPG